MAEPSGVGRMRQIAKEGKLKFGVKQGRPGNLTDSPRPSVVYPKGEEMSKVVGYLVTDGKPPNNLYTYKQAKAEKGKMFVVTEFSSIQDAVSCPDSDCCGCLVQDIFKDNEIRCNECGEKFVLTKVKL